MKKPFVLIPALFLVGCSLGHKEVKYSEMASPPKALLTDNEIIITTVNSIENPTFTIYEIMPTLDEGEKLILLKGHQSMGREGNGKFRITIKDWKHNSLAACKVFWVDPDNKRTQLRLEVEDSVKRDTIK